MSEQPAEGSSSGEPATTPPPAAEVQIDPVLIGTDTKGLEPDFVKFVPELEGRDTFSASDIEKTDRQK